MTEYTKRKLDNFIRSPYTKPIDVGFIKEIALDVFDGCSMQEIQKYLFTQIQTFKPKNEIEGKNLVSVAHFPSSTTIAMHHLTLQESGVRELPEDFQIRDSVLVE